ncbi:hypothetical protein V6347_18800 [Acinetobacter baumannii]|uniref:hypothetical protein n=1 Tax=Acinetobacter baumannii TaxID=470 RepID=UPI00214855EE|nr:hypothetical protein [Acinetobacter baumannii]MCR0008296.1 hypothetical protein [Acinetobacter baumannii]MCZ3010199.1 hypothetical protein [Acinetobacter baumannii]HAV3580445.1 hypothetical protein [Acinetobacter baumannii]
MKKYLYNIIIITTVLFISNSAYTVSDIQQGQSDILAFDPSRACDVLVVKLEKMEEEIDQKQGTINELNKILISAAKHSPNYGNIRSEYIRASDQLKFIQNEYGRLVLAKEKNCMSEKDKQSIN